ncbi:Protein kinase-like domain protein [Niveomyces insectorum RCEF 264]|uniref:Protein kinase-like domain protein n=1 Tax=Niveomyces insectorum RCEF 264 TaxID=1081102 RepID=A0A167ZUE6_9HYPO|nr:Protein kinase-like domain protein [Niveomyces insectorum RCEF 264]
MDPGQVDELAEEAAKLTIEELGEARKRLGFCTAEGHAITGFPYPPERPLFYAKLRTKAVLRQEARTQQFAYEGLEKMPPDKRHGIRVPRVLRLVENERGNGFIIMEYVHGETLKSILARPNSPTYGDVQPYFDRISKALRLFLEIPVPADAKPGPCGGGIIHHTFYKDFEAAIEYESIDMLEAHLNKLATFINKAAPTLTLERELHLVYSDLHEANFLFRGDDLYVVDFDHAALLPLSYMAFALRFPSIASMTVAGHIRHDFDLPQDNQAVMAKINGFMGMAVSRIGLPLEGYPNTGPEKKRMRRPFPVPEQNRADEKPRMASES